MRSYSKAIAGAFNRWLTDDDWKYDFNEGDGRFSMRLQTSGKLKVLNYNIFIEDDAFGVYAQCGVGVEKGNKAQMRSMAEFLMRANYRLKHGSFELDMEDGEISYKCHVECGSQVPDDSVIRFSIHACANAFEQYEQGILGILMNNADPEEMFDLCQSKRDGIRKKLLDLLEGNGTPDVETLRSALLDVDSDDEDEEDDDEDEDLEDEDLEDDNDDNDEDVDDDDSLFGEDEEDCPF